MNTTEKLQALREKMKEKGLSAYIVPPADPHQSEYIPSYWKSRQWLSGFTGSAGTLVVTSDFAGLWTDSRYFIQALDELKDSGIELMKQNTPGTPDYPDWLADHLRPGEVAGMDGSVFSQTMVNYLKNTLLNRRIGINCSHDLPGLIWKDRPALPDSEIFEHNLAYAGLSRIEKLMLVRQKMEKKGVSHHLLSALDDIAWLFNLRGTDVEYNPVFLSYAIITARKAVLFIDENKVPASIAEKLSEEGISLAPYLAVTEHLSKLSTDHHILISYAKISHHVFLSIPPRIKKTDDISIPALLKARKNETEVKNIQKVMIRDGVALVKFFHWLEQNVGKEGVNEYSIALKLKDFRKEQSGYQGDSFATIAGYKDHGAIVHYSASGKSAYPINNDGILLLDSGGQYLDGTTDITRTLCMGKPTEEQITNYTLILKGLINLSIAIFPEGTKGFHLDILARQSLWQQGKNYGHSTGHGVGYFLNVHEGPQGISPSSAVDQALLPGMILSNEPGFYKEGDYGMRLENLIMVVPYQETSSGKFLKFETLTLFPFEIKLIDKDLLCEEELIWLNKYHQRVFESLSNKLGREDNQWLLEKTRKIK